MYFIGYDIGSSSVKGSLLHAETNSILASSQHPQTEMPMIAHQPGWAEQHPEEWWTAIVRVTKSILQQSSAKPDEIEAIGISYQMHGLVLIDQNLEVLRPSIIWCDSRAVDIGTRAFDQLGHDYCLQSLLNSPGNFTAAKLAWVAENEPHIYERVYKAMLPGDYIATRLTDTPNTTWSGLSEGVFYNFQIEDLSTELMSYFQFDQDLIPDIVPTFGHQSNLSGKAARELGLKEGTKVTYRAGDQPNNAFSLNVLQPGELAATAGTSGVIYGISDRLDNDPASRVNAFAHVNHDSSNRRIGILLCINGTGILNAWAKRNLKADNYPEMNNLANQTPIGSEGLVVLPFGNGAERVLENKNIGAHFHGLEFNLHSAAHVYRAIQEGIACSLKYGTDIMKEMNMHPRVIRAGHSNMFLSKLFREAVANLTQATIELYDTDGSEGAARGAGIGAGYYDFQSAFEGLKVMSHIEPESRLSQQYQDTYERWLKALERHI